MPNSSAYMRIYMQSRRDIWRMKGLCTRCGGPRSDPHTDCQTCRQARRIYQQGRRADERQGLEAV